jgi:hypothetical protein
MSVKIFRLKNLMSALDIVIYSVIPLVFDNKAGRITLIIGSLI